MSEAFKHFAKEKQNIKKFLTLDFELFVYVTRISDKPIHVGPNKNIRIAYSILDEFLGEIYEITKKKKWNLLITSDHGFEEVESRFAVNTYLQKQDFLKVKSKSYQRKTHMASIVDKFNMKPLAKTILKKINKLPKFTFQETIDQLDLESTTAFALGHPTHRYAEIYLHDERFANGKPMNGTKKKKIIDDLTQIFKELKINEKKFITNIYTKEMLYSGDRLKDLPDLVLELPPAYSAEFRLFSKIINKCGKERCIHGLEGTIIGIGPDIKSGFKIKNARIFDVAPTVTTLLGYEPEDMDGKVLNMIT